MERLLGIADLSRAWLLWARVGGATLMLLAAPPPRVVTLGCCFFMMSAAEAKRIWLTEAYQSGG